MDATVEDLLQDVDLASCLGQSPELEVILTVTKIEAQLNLRHACRAFAKHVLENKSLSCMCI